MSENGVQQTGPGAPRSTAAAADCAHFTATAIRQLKWAATPSRLCAPFYGTQHAGSGGGGAQQQLPVLRRNLHHVSLAREVQNPNGGGGGSSGSAEPSSSSSTKKSVSKKPSSSDSAETPTMTTCPAATALTPAALGAMSFQEVLCGVLDLVRLVQDLHHKSDTAVLSLSTWQIAVTSAYHHRPSPHARRWILTDLSTAVDASTAAPHTSALAVARWLAEDLLPALDATHWAEVGLAPASWTDTDDEQHQQHPWRRLQDLLGVSIVPNDATEIARWVLDVHHLRAVKSPARGGGSMVSAPPASLTTMPDDATAAVGDDSGTAAPVAAIAAFVPVAEALEEAADLAPPSDDDGNDAATAAAAAEANEEGGEASSSSKEDADGARAAGTGDKADRVVEQRTSPSPLDNGETSSSRADQDPSPHHHASAVAAADGTDDGPHHQQQQQQQQQQLDDEDCGGGGGEQPSRAGTDTSPGNDAILETEPVDAAADEAAELASSAGGFRPEESDLAAAGEDLEASINAHTTSHGMVPNPTSFQAITNGGDGDAGDDTDDADHNDEPLPTSNDLLYELAGHLAGLFPPDGYLYAVRAAGVSLAADADPAAAAKRLDAALSGYFGEARRHIGRTESSSKTNNNGDDADNGGGGPCAETMRRRVDATVRHFLVPWLLEPAVVAAAHTSTIALLLRESHQATGGLLSTATAAVVARLVARLLSATSYGARDRPVRRALLSAIADGVGFAESAAVMLAGGLQASPDQQALLPSSFTIQFLALDLAASASALLQLPILVSGSLADAVTTATELRGGWAAALTAPEATSAATIPTATADIALAAQHVEVLRSALQAVHARGIQMSLVRKRQQQQQQQNTEEEATTADTTTLTPPPPQHQPKPDVERARMAAAGRMRELVSDTLLPWAAFVLQHARHLVNAAAKCAAATAPSRPPADAAETEEDGASTPPPPTPTDASLEFDLAVHGNRMHALNAAIGRLVLAAASILLDGLGPLGHLGLCPPGSAVRRHATTAVCAALALPIAPESRVRLVGRLESLADSKYAGALRELELKQQREDEATAFKPVVWTVPGGEEEDSDGGDAEAKPKTKADGDDTVAHDLAVRAVTDAARAIAEDHARRDRHETIRALLPAVSTLAGVPNAAVRVAASRIASVLLADLRERTVAAAAAATDSRDADGSKKRTASMAAGGADWASAAPPMHLAAAAGVEGAGPSAVPTPYAEAAETATLLLRAEEDVLASSGGGGVGASGRPLDSEVARTRLWLLLCGGRCITPGGHAKKHDQPKSATAALFSRFKFGGGSASSNKGAASSSASVAAATAAAAAAGGSGSPHTTSASGGGGGKPLPDGPPLDFAAAGATEASYLLPWATD